jgi:hypothetical protein
MGEKQKYVAPDAKNMECYLLDQLINELCPVRDKEFIMIS